MLMTGRSAERDAVLTRHVFPTVRLARSRRLLDTGSVGSSKAGIARLPISRGLYDIHDARRGVVTM